MTRIIFFDIDGTLRRFDENGIRPSVYRAVDMARQAGVKCFVATGRHPLEIQEEGLLGDLQFDGYVYLNGSYCVDGEGNILHHTPIDPSQIRILLELKAREDFSLLLMEAGAMYIDSTSDHVERMQAMVHTRVPPIVPDLRPSLNRTVYQMVLFADNPTLDRLMEQIPLCSATRWTDEGGALDVTAAGGDKCAGIRQVLAHYGISAADVAAIGDGLNDVEMLGMVGLGIAMGSGCIEAHRAACCVAPDIDADGLLWAVETILNRWKLNI